ncbi:redox-regulated ATPase YchF [Candidatus Fermentibacteria bacterium]|nr:MAG: redox-regulated ATPase YchF [Candidatus Fermentibacteria bacterium]
MKIALAGQPGCGRSTLYRALAENPLADTGKPLTVHVPDPRIDFLKEHWQPKSVVAADVTFTDVPSPSFSPKNMSAVKEATALAFVLDNYALGNLEEAFLKNESELMISDFSIAEKRLARLQKESKGKSPEARLLAQVLEKLENEIPLRQMELTEQEEAIISPYAFASLKPLLVISNRSGKGVADETSAVKLAEEHGGSFLGIDSGFELELAEIPEDERGEFLESMGFTASGRDRLLAEAYSLLDLISFLTMGKDEVRAWPIKRGSTALEAAGTIHSDLARGFIRAQVIPYELFKRTPDETTLRKTGEIGLQGKDYIVQDGDILEIKFSV